jgi:hypothetical protein
MGSFYYTIVASILLFPWSLLAVAIIGHLGERLSRRRPWTFGRGRNPARLHSASRPARP